MENILFDPLNKMTISLFHGTADALFGRVPRNWRELSQVTGSMLLSGQEQLDSQIRDVLDEGKFSISVEAERNFVNLNNVRLIILESRALAFGAMVAKKENWPDLLIALKPKVAMEYVWIAGCGVENLSNMFHTPFLMSKKNARDMPESGVRAGMK